MTLSQTQCSFALMLSKLIAFANEKGYQVKLCNLWRTPQEQEKNIAQGLSKTKNSMHIMGLASDLALFLAGELVTDESKFRLLGEYWESIGGRWGGRFGVKPEDYAIKLGWDVDHFELHYVAIGE